MLRKLLVVAVALLLAGPAAAADTYKVDATHSEVMFSIRHLIGRVSGQFRDFSGTVTVEPGQPASSSVQFAIKAASIDTGNERRDTHLRSDDFFAVEKYPEITFTSSAIKAVGGDSYQVSGTLTMRGVSKQVVLEVESLGFAKDPWGAERAGFALKTTLNRKDFGIEWNQTLDQGGLLLGDEVGVEINIEAVKQKAATD
jgi:polyisoprenoid-binding protein YceI